MGHERRNSTGGSHFGGANAATASATAADVERDTLHDAVVQFCMQRPLGRCPLVRLSRGVYLYGNKKLVIAMHNDKLMARIGGGFVHLDSYLAETDRSTVGSPASPAPADGMAAW